MSAAIANDNSSRRLQCPYDHDLVLQELSDGILFWCSICSSRVKGDLPVYHCPDCNNILLHKYCTELPFVIQQHPFHPQQHQLKLTFKDDRSSYNMCCSGCSVYLLNSEYHYRCDDCEIVLHVGCLAATLPTTHKHDSEHKDKPEEETIQHVSHEHPLLSFSVDNSQCPPYCWTCQTEIFGRAYGCRACIFMLHESCALAPQEIESHPLHPQHPLTFVVDFKDKVITCGACRIDYLPSAYHCHGCEFSLHLRCAVSVERHHISISHDDHDSEKIGLQIRHFSHPHPLTYCYTKEAIGLICRCCAEQITDDFYVCPDCSFMLHKSCAELSREMKHPSHPDHYLMLQTDPYDCFLCGDELKDCVYPRNEFSFKCQECDLSLHLRCALQTLSLSKEELTINIQHIHKHPMRLRYFSGALECDICREKCHGLAYGCVQKRGACSLIHKTCAELPQQSVFSVHAQHPLLLTQPTKWSIPIGCGACHKSDTMYREFVLLCDPCQVKFHARCVLKKPTLKHQRHEHALTYFGLIDIYKKSIVLCNVCGDDIRFDIYRCVPCNYNLHYSCSLLPPSVKHEWHVHPLVLRDKYINEDFDYDEQYCDLCETVRNPEHGVYYCVECRCATHIDCIIPKLVQDVEKRRRMDELELRKLNERIFRVEAEAETTGKELEASREKLERLTKDLAELKGKKQEILSSMMQPEEEFDRA